MVTFRQVRLAALSMLGVREERLFGEPAFCVQRTMFLAACADRAHVLVRLTPRRQALLIASSPVAYRAVEGVHGHQGWTQVALARVSLDQLVPVLLYAWRAANPSLRALTQVARTP